MKKLAIHRETLRDLSSDNLRRVVGGHTGPCDSREGCPITDVVLSMCCTTRIPDTDTCDTNCL